MECIKNSTEKLSMELYHSNLGACFHKGKVLDSCTNFVSNEKNPRSELNLNKGIKISDMPSRFKSGSFYPSAIVSLKEAIENELKYGKRQPDPNMDMKKRRRTLSNRLSAQRSRGKKAQYILDMEKKVELLRDTISVLTPQVQSQKEKRKLLSLEKDSLQQEVDKVFNKEKLHEMELKMHTLEINKLKELEKFVNNDTHYPNHGPWHFSGLSSKFFKVQMYPNLNFYERRLQNLQKSGNYKKLSEFGQCGTKNQLSIFAIKKFHDMINQDEADIDKYLDFNAMHVDLSDD